MPTFSRIIEAGGITASLDVVTDGVGAFELATQDVARVFERTGGRLSMDDPASELNAIRRGLVSGDAISDEMQRILDRCRLVTAMTDGAFRPHDAAGRLDLSGLIHGWAVKRGGEVLQDHGLVNWRLDINGDLLTSGSGPDGRPWRVMVPKASTGATPITVVELSGQAVATSGSSGGRIWSTDGSPLDVRGSATVVGPQVDIADALATGSWAMGAPSIDLVHRIPEYHLLLIIDDEVLMSDAFPAVLMTEIAPA